MPITHDAIWQVWIGRQLFHGAKLYSDIIEINPPLWFWLAVPLGALSELISARVVIIGFFTAAIGLSLYLSPARYRLILLVAFVLLPLQDFGQREHYTLIASVPYVFLIAARSKGEAISHPVLIALFAAVGFALKPWFALVPLSLELLVRKRVRPETVTLAAAALAYIVAVLLFAPRYLTDVVPIVRDSYDSFQGQGRAVPILAASLFAVGMAFRKSETKAMAVAAVAFLPALILQGKGWDYHSIPARGFIFLTVAVELMRHREKLIPDSILAASALLCFYPFGFYHNPFRDEAERHLAGVPAGSSIVSLSTNPMMAWPMVEEHKLVWVSRYMCLWQLSAVTFDSGDPASVRRVIADDLKRRPDIIIIDRRQRKGPAVRALIPSLDGYRLKLRTELMESWTAAPDNTKTP